MEKGFNDFYQELWYYHVVTFKPDQKEKELPAKSVIRIWVNCTPMLSSKLRLVFSWNSILLEAEADLE